MKNIPIINDLERLYGDGFEGFIKNGRYLQLWPKEKLLELNGQYEIDVENGSLIAIGSDGADEAYVILKSDKRIYSLPFIGMFDAKPILIADSVNDFMEMIPKASK